MWRRIYNRVVRKAKRRGITRVWCKWDDDAKVWYVAKSDLPGIAAEAGTLEELGQVVLAMAEDLIEESNGNGVNTPHREVPVELLSRFSSHAHC